MPETVTLLKALVASPGDVAPERAVLDIVRDDINQGAVGELLQVQLGLIRFEDRTIYPGVGPYVQAVINDQVKDVYDILIGVFWQRMGTPTPAAESGTKEEFDQAYERFRARRDVQIMLYFKNERPTGEIDPVQLEKLTAFKNSLGPQGVLYKEFSTTADFERQVRAHLSKYFADIMRARRESESGSKKNASRALDYESVMRNLTAASRSITVSYTRSSMVFKDYLSFINGGKEELSATKGNKELLKSVLTKHGLRLAIFAEMVQDDADKFARSFQQLFDNYSQAVGLVTDPRFGSLRSKLFTVQQVIESWIPIAERNRAGLEAFKKAVSNMPPMNPLFASGAAELAESLDNFCREITLGIEIGRNAIRMHAGVDK